MPAGRPRKNALIPPKRVDKKSEEYYLDRALQTPGLLTGAEYMKALERLTQLRGPDTREKTAERKSERLARFLGRNPQENKVEQDRTDCRE